MTSSDRVTRNPETTEAAKEAEVAAIEAVLDAHRSGMGHIVDESPYDDVTYSIEARCSCGQKFKAANDAEPDAYDLHARHVAESIAAVLAVSPAVTKGERPDVEEERIDALENALVEYDERGDLFGTSGAGAYFLAKFLVDRGWTPPAPSPAVTAAEDETHGYCTCDGPRPMRDCGVKTHRDQAFAARRAPVVAAVPADPRCHECGADNAHCIHRTREAK